MADHDPIIDVRPPSARIEDLLALALAAAESPPAPRTVPLGESVELKAPDFAGIIAALSRARRDALQSEDLLARRAALIDHANLRQDLDAAESALAELATAADDVLAVIENSSAEDFPPRLEALVAPLNHLAEVRAHVAEEAGA